MSDRTRETKLIIPFVLLLVLIGGPIFGQPIGLAYVETGSMEPTIDAGDGFVAVPSQLAGEPEPGDVVVYDAEVIEGGDLTTHRVVGETEAGYVTKGDANPFTDQDGGEPPVSDDRIVAEALTVGETVVVIPHLGTVIMTLKGGFAALGVSSISYLLIAVGLGFTVLGFVLDRGRRPERSTTRDRARRANFDTRQAIAIVTAVVVLSATAAMIVPPGPVTYGLLATDSSAEAAGNPLIVEAGEEATITHELRNDGLAPTVVVREPVDEGLTVESEVTTLGSRSATETSVHVVAPDEPTRFDRRVEERRYLAVLPPSLIVALHNRHPWLAILTIDLVVGIAIAATGSLSTRSDRIRFRAATRSVPIHRRVLKWLR